MTSLTLLQIVLLSNPAQMGSAGSVGVDISRAAPEDPVAEEGEESAEDEGWGDEEEESDTTPLEAGTPPPSETPPAAPEVTDRFNRWSLQIAPGAEFIFGGDWNAYGPNVRFGGWVHAWRGKFMVGGGPALHYTYLIDNSPQEDKLQIITVNGDFVIGGGIPDKIAGYAHLTAGLGAMYGEDGATGARILLPGIRGAAGGGLHGFVHRMVSLGALVDFGWYGGLGVDAFLTVGIHFKKKPK